MKYAIILALLMHPALAGEVTEQDKIEALKLGYILNGNSMVRWGSIDLTGPAQTKRMLDPALPLPPQSLDAPITPRVGTPR